MRRLFVLLAVLLLFSFVQAGAEGPASTLDLGLGVQGGDPASVLDLRFFTDSPFRGDRIRDGGVFFSVELGFFTSFDENTTVGFLGAGHRFCPDGVPLCASCALGVTRDLDHGGTDPGLRLGLSYPVSGEGGNFEVRADTFLYGGGKPFWTVSFGVSF